MNSMENDAPERIGVINDDAADKIADAYHDAVERHHAMKCKLYAAAGKPAPKRGAPPDAWMRDVLNAAIVAGVVCHPAALAAARAEGRREALEEAAEIVGRASGTCLSPTGASAIYLDTRPLKDAIRDLIEKEK